MLCLIDPTTILCQAVRGILCVGYFRNTVWHSAAVGSGWETPRTESCYMPLPRGPVWYIHVPLRHPLFSWLENNLS